MLVHLEILIFSIICFELINIFNLLPNKKNIQLLIIGDGPLLDECKSKVKQLNLENKIHFLGYKSNPYKYLSKSHIYLSTAKWEGMGNSIIEALFFGLYVIAYDSPGGVSEILKDGKFGSLIPYGDKQKFASDLINNLNNSNNNIINAFEIILNREMSHSRFFRMG